MVISAIKKLSQRSPWSTSTDSRCIKFYQYVNPFRKMVMGCIFPTWRLQNIRKFLFANCKNVT